MPARVVQQAIDALGSAGISYTPKFANVSAASSGDNVLVAAVSGKILRVVNVFLISAGTVNAYFVDGGNTNLVGDGTNKIALIANSGFVLPFSPLGWFETTLSESLDINLSDTIAVVGAITYIEV